ncbi:MAG: nucleotidyltransferase domain-containing protein [Candidatus Aegiribacteria sp.]|nr:nucleotidyltransferase domain-containing protein [Candidatus Aegiribacteria sp.]
MTTKKIDSKILVNSLRERAKELNCLYMSDEILMSDIPLEKKLQAVAESMPQGCYSPQHCKARIVYRNNEYTSKAFSEGGPELSENLVINGSIVGKITVSYPGKAPKLDNGVAFLEEEKKLIRTLARRISHTILHDSLSQMFEGEDADRSDMRDGSESWRAILDMLLITDRKLYQTLSRRLLNYMSFIGIVDATALLNRLAGQTITKDTDLDHLGINQPIPRQQFEISYELVEEIFAIAGRDLSDEQILNLLQRWIGENRIEHLINVLDDHASSLPDIIQAMDDHKGIVTEEATLSKPVLNALKVSLIRRLVSRRLDYISRLKEFVSIGDFYKLTNSLVIPAKSHGQLGGKGAGLFMAEKIIKNARSDDPLLAGIRTPVTWYVCSDGILDFVHHNRLEELLEYRYRYLGEIRLEYPNLIQLFKNCAFSPEMTQGLSMTLDSIGDYPLIVRSSSLLEDSVEAAFSGKYKSLFIANQGTKSERLEALMDAIAEVYASMFGPDAIEYRNERNLLDFQEEMGVLIQQVVGTRVGKYYMPAYGGVAFSRNEFRWSSRIRTKDGLLRSVPGLGTRAVDRLGDDFPVLAAPGQPGLRVNTSVDETIRYAPKFMDVINLEEERIETVKVEDIIREYGSRYPQVAKIFSTHKDGMIRRVNRLTDFENEYVIPTFEGLMTPETGFLKMMRHVLALLERECGFPVDIEFAADGDNIYLLQCRAQSSWEQTEAVHLTERPEPDDILFTADKYISDGFIREIAHIVYVDPQEYDSLKEMQDLVAVGKTVGRLNGILSKKSFVLMGPGRWGSRGDIKLGVQVTYSDINNTAALIEMAFQKGSYVPDLSFGTHFFQDLVEAGIRYLPLYPDDSNVIFNREFFKESENVLCKLLPDCNDLSHVVNVIDVKASTGGRILRIAMSGDEGEAIAYLTSDDDSIREESSLLPKTRLTAVSSPDEHWLWRQRMAETLASEIDPDEYGVKGIYLFGSTKNATSGPCSDIDLLIHADGNERTRDLLESYLDGWDVCLCEINYIRTGFKTEHLLDVHIITDRDIEEKQSYALKIGSVTDPARPLEMKKKEIELEQLS